jgi:uncharacterized protein
MSNKKNDLVFKISSLMEKGSGAKVSYSFDSPTRFDGIKTKSNATGSVEIMRLEDGVNVILRNYNQEVEMECVRCLKKFGHVLKFAETSRIFYLDPPNLPDDPNDIFLIDKKNQEIDITEMARQEIILHFPLVQVCYTSCKGICYICGQDKNKKSCDCKSEDDDSNKPLKALKDILKQ